MWTNRLVTHRDDGSPVGFSTAVKTSNKKGKKTETGSKPEIYFRIAESDSNEGDKSLATKVVDGVLRLWCNVCHAPLHANKVHTGVHLKSVAHVKGALALKGELDANKSMSKALELWRKNSPDLEGKTLSSHTDLFRLETVGVFMKCGLPLSKIDGLREYLQKYAKLQLTDESHMRTYVTLVRDIELDRIKMSLKKSNYFAIIFDGSSRVDEVLAVIARYVTKGNNNCLITINY